jgi:hypothetical protein
VGVRHRRIEEWGVDFSIVDFYVAHYFFDFNKGVNRVFGVVNGNAKNFGCA